MGKSSKAPEPAPEPTVVNTSNPGLDMYLQEQAAANQRQMQQTAQNAQLMQAPQTAPMQAADQGLKPPQQQEQAGLPNSANSQLNATLSALRGW